MANTDDMDIPASTLRTWVLGMRGASDREIPCTNVLDQGLALTVLLAGLNQFFFFRYPSVSISNFVAVLISLPLGRAWATVCFHRQPRTLFWLMRRVNR